MSKSVKLSTSAATTGTTKNTAIAISAGDDEPPRRAPRRPHGAPAPREDPAPLLEDLRRRARRARRPRQRRSPRAPPRSSTGDPPRRALETTRISVRDALPLRHRRRAPDALELVAERPRRARRRRARGSSHERAARRQVAGQRVEPPLHRRPRQVLDQLPRLARVRRARGTPPGSSRRRSTRRDRPGPGSGAVTQVACCSGAAAGA